MTLGYGLVNGVLFLFCFLFALFLLFSFSFNGPLHDSFFLPDIIKGHKENFLDQEYTQNQNSTKFTKLKDI